MRLALVPVLLTLLALGAPARAHCTLAALETTLVAGPAPTRADRWTWRVEEGPADCALVHLASPDAAPILDVQVRVDRPDARAPRLSGQRRSAEATSADPGFGPAPGLVLHTPELRAGDLLLVEVRRRWPAEAEGFTWRPGARGPLELATLRVEGDLPVQAEGLTLGPPALDGAARSWLVEEVPAGRPEPLGEAPARVPEAASLVLEQELLLPARQPVRGLSDPRLGATRSTWRQEGGLPSRVAWPPGARERTCTVDGQPCPEVGGLAWALPARGEAAWGWTVPGASASAELPLAGEGPRTRVELRVRAPGPVVVEGAAQGALAPATEDQALAPSARWRLEALGELPILPDAVAAEQAAAWLAIRASIPEPAIYDELRGRRQDPTVLEDLLALHHDRLRLGALPGQPPLAPRRLLKVRRSGWGSPWELALVLTRQLQQLKLDARPFATRPAELVPGDPASLAGWPLALVRVRTGDRELWIDPTCSSCAPGELLPVFDGAALLSSSGEALPPLAASTWRREVAPGADGQELRLTLAGPLAVQLRAELSALPPDARAGWLARRFGGPQARLVEHQGLRERGEDVRLTVWAPDGAPLPPPLPGSARLGSPALRLPAAGTWTERRILAAAPPGAQAQRWRAAEAQGLRWDRALQEEQGRWILEERLQLDARVLPRPGVAEVLSLLSQRWGQPAPGSAPAEGSPPPAPGPPAAP